MMKRALFWIIAIVMSSASAIASAEELLLGAGDVLRVTVFNNPDLATEARISGAGKLTFPLIGEVPVAGLTVAAAEKRIAGLLESGGFVKRPQVNALVTVVQSNSASVLGQVNRPGRYPIEGKRSVLDLLALAGGVGIDGGDVVSLIRNKDGVTSKEDIDIVKMVREGDLNRDIEVHANDVLFVERAPRFYIYGEVQRPGAMRLERGMTVLQALAAGGGLTPRGTERGLRLRRVGSDGKHMFVEVKADDLVQMDDVIYVKESWF